MSMIQTQKQLVCKRTLNQLATARVLVHELSGCEFESRCSRVRIAIKGACNSGSVAALINTTGLTFHFIRKGMAESIHCL